jgi:hypothetical protein
MAKRFTDTEIWLEDWFLDMPIEYKLFWYYIISSCDHAGIFKVNIRVFNNLNCVNIEVGQALKYFNKNKDRIRELSDNVWLIEDFFVYQYGTSMNLNNRVHESISKVYEKYDLKLTSIRGLKDLKDRVKDKDKDKEYNTLSKVKGETICENLEYVIFSDGTKQKLGELQRNGIVLGHLKPKDIIKGSTY